MVLQTKIKVSPISALLHNVPDTPFCKQFFWGVIERVNMPSEMDGLSHFSLIFSSLAAVTKDAGLP